MFIELVDVLRCLRPHEESWLVAATTRMQGRDIVEGRLGCPVCGAEYPIARGVVVFDAVTTPSESLPDVDESDDAALRLAAFLDLTESGGIAVLAGSWAAHAPRLADLVQTQLLLLNPPDCVLLGGGISAIRVREALPLAAGSCRGIAFDVGHASPILGEAAPRALRPRGRLLAPLSLAPPAEISELARDERWWVGERAPIGSRPVKLEIARG
jgi:uncharacterized protein YbaR (Trm112 family)